MAPLYEARKPLCDNRWWSPVRPPKIKIHPAEEFLFAAVSGPETISDGYGLRYAIYFAGCAHRCPGCHNPESHDPRRGEPLTVERAETICAAIAANPILDGVTLSGGDPLLQPEAMAAFLRLVKERTGQNVWCYTGYTLEECLADPARRECLRWIDTLVDGRYVEALRDLSLDFRGSSNQRIIDVGALHLFG